MQIVDLGGKHGEGRFAFVDDKSFSLIYMQLWWAKLHRNTLYAVTDICKKRVYMHRLILGAKPGQIVDHIDGNGLNNSLSNLRIVSSRENSRNRQHPYRGKKSKYRGVSYDRERGLWCAKIGVDYKTINLGRFPSEVEAALAYDHAFIQYFGALAGPNMPALADVV